MDATVDDLTNCALRGPDPAASGDDSFTKVWSFTAGQTWTLKPTLLLDTTFGFARQKQDVLGPDFDAGNFGLDVLQIPGHERSELREPDVPRALRRLSELQYRPGQLDGCQLRRQP